MGPHSSLADYLRAWKIDNFSIDGERVRIGHHEWLARECHCGLPDCDGWEIRPVGEPRAGLTVQITCLPSPRSLQTE